MIPRGILHPPERFFSFPGSDFKEKTAVFLKTAAFLLNQGLQ